MCKTKYARIYISYSYIYTWYVRIYYIYTSYVRIYYIYNILYDGVKSNQSHTRCVDNFCNRNYR